MTEDREKKNRLTFSDKFRKQMRLVAALAAIQAYNDGLASHAPPVMESQAPIEPKDDNSTQPMYTNVKRYKNDN